LAQDDLLEKIKRLEQQIQELKTLKEQQIVSALKTEQCMKVVARDAFCNCVGSNLPPAVNFENYVHTLVSSKESLGYAGLPQEQKQVIDATVAVRDKCIEKGFFK
jgi:hypothetical protein